MAAPHIGIARAWKVMFWRQPGQPDRGGEAEREAAAGVRVHVVQLGEEHRAAGGGRGPHLYGRRANNVHIGLQRGGEELGVLAGQFDGGPVQQAGQTTAGAGQGGDRGRVAARRIGDSLRRARHRDAAHGLRHAPVA